MSDVLTEKVVKTRKPHICFGCGRQFPKDTEMTYQTVADGGTVNTFYICGTCIEVMSHMDYWDEFRYGELREDALELESERGKNMKYKTDCPCYSEVNVGNPGGVPHCSHYGLEPDCENCKRPKRTKADRVRSMTDNELAEYMATREAAMADVIFGIAERVLMEKRGYKIKFTDHFKPDLLQMKREYLAMLQQEVEE